MTTYQIETTANGGIDETVEASDVVLKDEHFLFIDRTGTRDKTVFIIPAKFVGRIRAEKK